MCKYVLDDDEKAVLEPDLSKWAKWFETADRHVAGEDIGGARVSTVFLGLDHSLGDGPPMLYETMIFGGNHDQHQERCGDRVAALAMHDRAMALVRDSSRATWWRWGSGLFRRPRSGG